MIRVLLQPKYRPLLVGAIALVALPLVMPLFGLTVDTASVIVILSIATMGLNVLVGYTGLTSFGHSAWFGIGAYAAALAQKHWFHGQLGLPIAFAIVFVAALSAIVGVLILRRRGVYFALLTLALVALTYAIAFRWTEVTGGEDGLGGLERGRLGPINFDNAYVYYVFVGLIAFGTLYALLRVARSPFGHVLVAIRENQQRATFQGYDVDRYRLGAFVLSAAVTALAGALTGFQHYLASAESTSIQFSGELLAMVVIGGMYHILGPALGVLFFILFRELFSMWSANWLLWFGLVFVGFVLYSPGGLVGIAPSERESHQKFSIRKFDTLYDAVKSYMNNLNVSSHYAAFRELRAELSRCHAEISGTQLTPTLTRYSIEREAYVRKLDNMIRHNRLNDFDTAQFRGTETPFQQSRLIF